VTTFEWATMSQSGSDGENSDSHRHGAGDGGHRGSGEDTQPRLVPLKPRSRSAVDTTRAGKQVKQALQEYEKLSSRVNTLLSKSALSRTPTGRLPVLCTANTAVQQQALEIVREEEERRRAERLKQAHEGWLAWRRAKDEEIKRKKEEEEGGGGEGGTDGFGRRKRRAPTQESHEVWVQWRAEKDAEMRRRKARERRAKREKEEEEAAKKKAHAESVDKLFSTYRSRPTAKSQQVRSVPRRRKLAKLSVLSHNPLTEKMSKTEVGWAPHDPAVRAAIETGELSQSAGALEMNLTTGGGGGGGRKKRRRRKRHSQRQRQRGRGGHGDGNGEDGEERDAEGGEPSSPQPQAWASKTVQPRRRRRTSPHKHTLSPLQRSDSSPFSVPLKIGARLANPGLAADAASGYSGSGSGSGSAAGKRRGRPARRQSSPPRPDWNFDTKPVSVIEEIRLKEAMRAAKREELKKSAGPGGMTPTASFYDMNGRPLRRNRSASPTRTRRSRSRSRSRSRTQKPSPSKEASKEAAVASAYAATSPSTVPRPRRKSVELVNQPRCVCVTFGRPVFLFVFV